MSKASRQFIEQIKQPEASMGALEATKEGVVGAIAAFLSGAKEVGDFVWDTGKPMFDHGRTEMAAALFSPHGSGFVMYGGDNQQGQNQPMHGLPAETKQPEVEQDRGGHEM